ncbi:MAG: hypothetical protein J0M12_01695 [Deltaproteobacteria bacterium]|nr:hypothetical protein [Deltaproteobacteria bacterium]
MKTILLKKSLTVVAILALAACSSSSPSATTNVAAGGIMGAAAGTATGAIVGAAISNGNVGQSAALGAGIGIPVGMLAGAMYNEYSDSAAIEDNTMRIIHNKQQILEQEQELESMRNSIREDSSTEAVGPDSEDIEYQYLGPSLGNPYR